MDAASESVQGGITDERCEGEQGEVIKSKENAAMYTEEQRAGVCKWCRENNHNKCKECAIPITPAYEGEQE